MTLEAIRTHLRVNDESTYIRSVFVSLGVDPANIKSVHWSPGGFAANPRRWCVVLHKAVRLSAVQVNAVAGVSGAIVNGNVWWVLVGKGE